MSEVSSMQGSTYKESSLESSPRMLEANGRRSSAADPQGIKTSIHRHFMAELSPRGADYIILVFWFITGFLDSTIFQAYRTFVSMQTGNTIFIALSAAATTIRPYEDGIPIPVRPYGWLKSLVSLVAFLLGSIFFARLARMLRSPPNRRWIFATSFSLQTFLILLSAVLVQTGVIESRLEYIGEEIDWLHLVPIALLSFQAPGQVTCGRVMGLPEVSTVVVTTMVYDFGSDDRLFVGFLKNAVRNRRFAGWLLMLIGAIIGGFLTVNTRHIVETMWVGSVLKAGVTVAWIVWPAKKDVAEGVEA